MISEPYEKRFQRFRINNAKVKKLIIEPKGVLQYAVEVSNRQAKMAQIPQLIAKLDGLQREGTSILYFSDVALNIWVF